MRTGRAVQKRVQPYSFVSGREHLRPARVLMTADCVGGVWTYALDLARGLAAQNVEVILATMGDLPSPAQAAQAHVIPSLTLCSSALKLEWMPDCWADVGQAGNWLLELEEQFSPDIVHLNGYAHGALPWHAPALVVAHSCVLSWWEAVKNEPAPPEWDTYHEHVTAGLQSAECVIAPTAAMLAVLDRHYGPFFHSEVISNGREHSLYCAADKEPFILTAGRVWDEAKNVGLLEQIAPHLKWPVYVAGAQSHPAAQHPTPNTHHPQYGFHLLGSLPPGELADWYSRASIYALPARYEPFGLSILEAALSGCALVLGDIGSLQEVWGESALYASPNNAQEWRQTLTKLIANPELRQEMAQRAQVRAQRYTLGAMTTGYLNVYGQLLTTHAAVPYYHHALSFPTEPEESLP